jgi:inner membrane protein
MENQSGTADKQETGNFMRFLNSSFGRFILIGTITIMLLIPLARVIFLIEERKERAESIKEEIRSEWGTDFFYSGIALRIPFKDAKKKSAYLFYFPEKENNKLNVQVSSKKRGIYHFPVFQCSVFSEANFIPELNDPNLDLEHVQIGLLSDPRCRISDIGKIKLNGKELEIEEEAYAKSNSSKLFYATAPFAIDKSTAKINVDLNYSVNGSGKIVLQGHAKKNQFTMTSNWTKPSFTGSSLPDPNSFKQQKGFSSSWKIMNIAQNPKRGNLEPNRYSSTDFASVEFLESIDHYQLNERTVKYAILVILLTFTVFYLIELIGKTVIHPIHYLMVGLSLILFYAILLSFSEQFGFAYSYLTASIGILSLLSWYAYSVLRSLKFALTIFMAISILYSFLYVIVNLETYALIVGSLGLFVVLAAIMSFTRRLKV